MVHIDSSQPRVIHELPYLSAGTRGSAPVRGVLEIEVRRATGLRDLAGMVVTSDLQFRSKANDGSPDRLLGEVLAEELSLLSDLGELPPTEEMAVILAGDLYCGPTLSKRGENGDVRPVWEAFSQRFLLVTGVLGNHDTLGPFPQEQASFRAGAGRHLLDGTVVEKAGVRTGGLSGIIGNPARPNRRSENDYLAGAAALIARGLHVLVLHEPPALQGQTGNVPLAGLLSTDRAPLVVCGHAFWQQPLVEVARGAQVLNVDSRCIVLLPGS